MSPNPTPYPNPPTIATTANNLRRQTDRLSMNIFPLYLPPSSPSFLHRPKTMATAAALQEVVAVEITATAATDGDDDDGRDYREMKRLTGLDLDLFMGFGYEAFYVGSRSPEIMEVMGSRWSGDGGFWRCCGSWGCGGIGDRVNEVEWWRRRSVTGVELVAIK
ncbi:hypothetical protein RHGRI_031246 [Rhododendron griersonianum]|uniref:Uncharacterized protein n=1 Tax=Rhododendron griersonianum TaxID=479676 RepID=A0AAV6I9N5_9ERIC|nr:hypothetical protein RHGRI_031246 [Rhododendron griersonianum]